MIRKIKALGIAFVAILAMGAVMASGAQADEGIFTASEYPASGSGGQTTPHKFTVQGSAVECSTATFAGSLSEESTSLNITPTYLGCKAFGFLEATVSMNGCYYEFTPGNTNGGTHKWKGSVHVRCPEGKTITVVAATCTVHIPAQTPTTPTVDYENITASKDVLVTSTVSGIHSNVTSGFLCPLTTNSTDTSGVYTGTVTFVGANGVGIDVGHASHAHITHEEETG